MAVKLGLRSYALPGTARDYDPDSNESLADFVKRQNLGSFTLGPIEVNAPGAVQCRRDDGLGRAPGARRTRSTRSSTATAPRCR